MENTSPTTGAGAQRYRVLAVEPDERMRTRMTLELAGIVPVPADSYGNTPAWVRVPSSIRTALTEDLLTSIPQTPLPMVPAFQ